MTKITLNVEGMHCRSCVMLVEDALDDRGVSDVNIELDEKTQKAVVSCNYDGDKMDVVNVIKKEGFKVLK